MSENEEKNDDLPSKKSAKDFPIQEYKLVPVDYTEETGSEDEIDLLEIIKTIWENRKTVYRFVALGTVLGTLVALFTPKEYRASATLMPEYSTESTSSGTSSLLREFGGAFGLNTGSYNASSSAIRVELYPKVVQSLTFQDKLARQKFYFSNYDTTASLYTYYSELKSPGLSGFLKKYTIDLPGTIFGLFKKKEISTNSGISDNEIIVLTEEEIQIIDDLRQRVMATLDEESGIVSVSAKMGTPRLAANVAKYTIEELTSYLTAYRIEKVSRDLEFVKEQLDSAEVRFSKAQLSKADYEDSNQGSQTARANTERERLESEYNLAFNIYSTLSQQYEEAKIKVQEETPVFKVLQPVHVPVKDEVSGLNILLMFMVLSFISAATYIGIIYIRDRELTK